MSNFLSNDSRVNKIILWLGIILLVGPSATLFIMYGNNEITGPITTFLPLNFLSSMGGLVLIGISLFRRAKSTSFAPQRRHLGYVMLVIAALMLLPAVIGTSISAQHDPLHIILLAVLANTLIGVLNPFFLLFFFGGIYLIKPLALTSANEKARSYQWVFMFALAGMFFSQAIRGWTDHVLDPFIPRWLGCMMVAAIALSLSVTKIIRKQSWTTVLLNIGGVEARDEREVVIMEKASRLTLVCAFLSLIVAAAATIGAPSPSPQALCTGLVAYALLLAGLRSFFSWRLGLRA